MYIHTRSFDLQKSSGFVISYNLFFISGFQGGIFFFFRQSVSGGGSGWGGRAEGREKREIERERERETQTDSLLSTESCLGLDLTTELMTGAEI